MSKYRENVLIFLGILACAGFILFAPAAADSGRGLTALESGDLLSFSFDDPPMAENGSKSSIIPPLEDQDGSAGADPAPPADSGGEPVVPVGSGDINRLTSSGGYDDERLAGLIDTASIRLMRLSMEHAHALYLQDAPAAAVAADDLHALSIRLLGEVESLQISPQRQPVRDEFVRSLSAYSAASKTLLDPDDTSAGTVPSALRDLAVAAEGLEEVSRETGEIRPHEVRIPMMSVAGAGTVTVSPPEKVLPLMDRHTYDDPSGENMVSLIVESTRTATTYRALPVNTSTPDVEADEGRTFLLVVVKSTNLGHRGDSDLYTIETPGREAFTLEYQGLTFKPIEVPPFTSPGESFDRKVLERYESQKGYLYFDVPATLNVSNATLRADLGDAGAPVWDLGREPGAVSGDAGGD